MGCHPIDRLRRQLPADRQHHAQRIIVPLAVSPRAELSRDIGGALARQRRIGRPDSLPLRTVTGSAGAPIEGRGAGIDRRTRRGRSRRQAGIISRHFRAVLGAQPQRNGTHRLMVAPAIGIIVDLAMQVARVEPRQARRLAAVALAAEPMAGHAGVLRTAVPPAERDRFSSGAKPVRVRSGCGIAGTEGGHQSAQQQSPAKSLHPAGTYPRRDRFPCETDE